MALERPPQVSVTDPIGPATNWTKYMLFRPFQLEKWLAIGLCAWLANLGQRGGFNFNMNFDSLQHMDPSEFNEIFEKVKYYFFDNMYWIIPVGILILIFIVVLTLVLLYFNSRGRFMFLHCVANNVSQIGHPWSQYKKQAHSLFGFQIILTCIGLLLVMVIIADILGIILPFSDWEMRLVCICVLPVLLFISLILFIIQKFTQDFVVPIMYLRKTGCMQGWHEFYALLSMNKARFLLYLLFQVVITIAIGIIALMVFVLSCCMLCCIGCIPFVGQYVITVILLPLSVFCRTYSLYYLSQFHADYHIIGMSPPPPTPAYPYIDPYQPIPPQGSIPPT